MTRTTHAGCEEFERASRTSRRGFLRGVAGTTGAMVTTRLFGETLLEASHGASTTGNVLVVVSFRGGIDGLGVVVPHADPGYYAARRSIAVSRSSVIAADASFGLHPQMAPLLPMWNSGRLAAVQAVGLPVPNRSHFKAIEEVEDADPGSSVRRGWVNRMIGLGGIVGPAEAVHLSTPLSPTMFAGPAPTMATDGFKALTLPGLGSTRTAKRYAGQRAVWSGTSSPLTQAAADALSISSGLASRMSAAYTPANGARYPTAWPSTELAEALRDAANLIKRNVGTTVISIDYGSWDMHADYGNQTGGQMQAMVGGFAAAVAAFFTDLGTLGERVTLATISEFGRRVAENGNRGLDHGWGNMMLVAGGGVRGGQYYGRWPGLSSGNLVAGDLQVTTDYRNVLGEIVARRFPDRSLGEVFPGLSYRPLGLMA
ncbi:Uncharacterized conserved protein, DUF1501 family [Nocardioides scoriae]|uniref:Uncharacterized conserved protein, DUF1501 family n=1 Tax=Nocardioides scoriae TaxID=642780 RepID=A0A1H1MNH4_9ACTN|nr:DUF1501 domain-containing protein [Nocardioides scoriae]SDR88160.1 Uncharacterized conserved protein, DUF1501 family [Nocardioides scoriae]